MLIAECLFLRNHSFALHRSLAGCGGLERSNTSCGLAVRHYLEVITSARRQALKTRVMVLAVGSVSRLHSLREVGTIGAILHARAAGRVPGGPADDRARIAHRLRYRTIGDLVRASRLRTHRAALHRTGAAARRRGPILGRTG